MTHDPRFRPLPLWAWNGEVTEARIESTLAEFSSKGFGGAFIHPRPGLITEYLSQEWFELWKFAQVKARQLGLEVHVYDENSYPSGFAGGHVLEVRPDLALSRLVATADPELEVHTEPTDSSGWYAGRTYVDVLHPEAARVFIDLTHRRYAESIESQGLFCFTDEPSVMDYSRGALPWSDHVRTAFENDHGYDLSPHLVDLYRDAPGAQAHRYRYQETLQKLFGDYLDRLRNGCAEAGMKLCGHLHEHEWPCPRYHANSMEAYARFDVPGIDLLGFQFRPDDKAGAGRWLMTVLEAASVAAQLGKDTVMCEAFGGGGYECGPAYFKRAGDFLLAYGTNLMVPHMGYLTTVGARKYDWPQTISDHAPFWEAMQPLNQHLTGVATFLSEGQSLVDLLVLQPTASGWLDWTPDSEAAGRHEELPPRTAELRSRQAEFLSGLADQHVDFHLGDEWVMERYASVEDGVLRFGESSYRTVLVPETMETIRLHTLELLEALVARGGMVFLMGNGPTHLDGVPSPEPARRLSVIASRPKLTPMLVAPAGLVAARRRTPQGTAWFVANPWDQPVEGALGLNAPSVRERDSVTGEERLLRTPTTIRLEPGEHRLWTESDDPSLKVEPGPIEIPIELVHIRRMKPNVLPIDRCRLSVGDESFPERPTIKQNRSLWQRHGFQGDPWEWGVQFRREFVDATLPDHGPVTVSYRFQSTGERPVRFAIERASLYQVELNGRPLSLEPNPFFDPAIQQSEPVVCHAGWNELTLLAPRLHVHMELAPVWVLGDFSFEQGRLAEAQEISFGPWSEAGMPFYPWGVEYVYRTDLRERTNLSIELVAEGSSALVRVNEHQVATWWDGARKIDLGVHPEGPLILSVELRGSLRNLLGPFHCDGLPGPWSWYEDPDEAKPPAYLVPTGLNRCRLWARS